MQPASAPTRTTSPAPRHNSLLQVLMRLAKSVCFHASHEPSAQRRWSVALALPRAGMFMQTCC